MPTVSETFDAILFDMDGTLVDSTKGVIGAWHYFKETYPQLEVEEMLNSEFTTFPSSRLALTPIPSCPRCPNRRQPPPALRPHRPRRARTRSPPLRTRNRQPLLPPRLRGRPLRHRRPPRRRPPLQVPLHSRGRSPVGPLHVRNPRLRDPSAEDRRRPAPAQLHRRGGCQGRQARAGPVSRGRPPVWCRPEAVFGRGGRTGRDRCWPCCWLEDARCHHVPYGRGDA